MIHIEQEPAFVLHRRPYKENHYLIDVLSVHYVCFRASVRIPQQRTHRQTHIYAPFHLLALSGQRKGELASLWQAEIQGSFIPPAGQPLLNAHYLNEILLGLLPMDDPAPQLFYQYAQALQSPDASALRRFEYALLMHLGLLPEMQGHAPYYSLDSSGDTAVLCAAAQGYRREILQGLLQGDPDWSHPDTRHLLQRLVHLYSQRRANTRKTTIALKQLLQR